MVVVIVFMVIVVMVRMRQVLREIVGRNQPEGGPSRGSRVALRGLYYSSPWVRWARHNTHKKRSQL